MNFNNNTMLYPKKDELNPTKDDGVNPSFYPKEEGFNPFNGIVERINALESITQNYEDSFETKELTVTENAQIKNLNATEGTVNRLNSANATVTNLNSTNATVINADVENAQIENLNATEGTVDTLNSTTSTITNLNSTTSTVTNGNIKNAKVESLNATEGKVNTLESTNATVTNLNSTNATVNTLNSTTSTVTNLNSTNGNIKNAEVENLNATEGTVDTLESTTSTVTNGNIKNAKVENLNVTKNAEIKKLHATEGNVDTLNLTNCNIKNADIENLHTNKLTWDLPNIDVINAETIKLHATEGTVDTLNSTNGNIINAEVKKLNVTTEIKVENFKTEEPIFSNAVVGYDENGKMIPIKIAELEEKVDKDLSNATGTLPVANGGTGVTTQADINKAFIGNLTVGNDNVTDGTEFVSSWASDNGFAETADGALNKPYKRQFVKVWNYIKDKISSVLGLTKDNYGGKASKAGTADKTVNDITIDIPYVQESGEYVIPLGNIPEPTSTAIESPYNWDITGFFSIIRPVGHNGSHLWFEAGHGYSHDWTTYAYLDKLDFRGVTTTIKAFQYNGKWWLGLCITTSTQGYNSKMAITYSRGLPATPTCILYNSKSGGVANEEIYNSIQDIPSSWWKKRTIYNPTTFTQTITAPVIQATTNFIGNVTGNVSGSSGSCTGKSAKSSFLDEYVGAGGTRLTSLNIVPKDSSEYGGMRKDVVTNSVTDGSRPSRDGHLLTMFWDNSCRYDSQFFISDSNPPVLKSRGKGNKTDYGSWIDIITSDNIGSQTVITSLKERVTALESDFDYTVDSQQKFDDLLSILKSGTPNTYRSIAIIGGLGNGEHGEYLYTVNSNSSDANLNNASLIGLNNPKIVITISNANTFKVFKNGLIKNIDFNIGGTVNAGKTVTLLHNCTYNNGKIALNNVSANFNIVDTTLSNVVNDECKSFVGCTLNDCETIQSAFTNCSSEMLYVSTDKNIANKYSFNKCGIHLDMKKTNMTQLETVTINISSMTDSKLTVLDTSSKLKKIILNVDASDSLSEIVGNNDKKYSIYEPFVKRVSKSVSPSMRSKAYLSYHDESHTPIFSNDGVKFYLDEAMTQQVYCYSTTNSNNEKIWMFALGNDDTHCYSSLTLNKEITYSQRDGESVAGLKLSDFGDEFILNGNSLKTYICRNDESGTLLYSNNNGTDVYISPYINDDNKVQYANPNTSSKLFMIGQFSYLTKNLGAFNVQPSFSDLNFATPQLLEVTALKDNYAVQVVSNYDVPIYVENAFSTKVKNG